jgi:hypothetical protein
VTDRNSAGAVGSPVAGSFGYDGGVSADAPYLLVRSGGDLQSVVNAVTESRYVGIDCETTGLDPRADRLRLVSLGCETNGGNRSTRPRRESEAH